MVSLRQKEITGKVITELPHSVSVFKGVSIGVRLDQPKAKLRMSTTMKCGVVKQYTQHLYKIKVC